MAPWFTLPVVAPLGLFVIGTAAAIYRAYLNGASPQTVAVKTSSNTSLPPELPLRRLA